VVDGRPGDEVLVRRDDDLVGRYSLDSQGALVVRGLRPGTHTVRQQRDGRAVVTRVVEVLAPDQHPPRSLYEGQRLQPGMNYLTTRDGTRLAAWVELPGPADQGPYPTVVEYSGYQIADPDITQPASAVARALGYATVGVNVRGTGCSAGAFDMFSPARAADGYDVVETVAAQPWVAGGTVGLVGFSFGGLGALEVASTAPPSLNSVVALSVYGRARQALHPGGLANSGFPVGWMQDLQADAEPLGAEWVRTRVAEGDATCARNQVLHGQAVDLVDRYLGDVPDDGRFAALGVASWARTVRAPVFLVGQLQDATIGIDLADHLRDFARSPLVRLVLTNGTHGDAVTPQILRRMDQFMALYAAGEVPDEFDTADLLAKTRPEVDPALVPDGPPPPVDLTGIDDVAEARERYEAGPKVEVLFESGNAARPEAAAAASSLAFATWPPPEADERAWWLASDGDLVDQPTGDAPPARFRTDPTVSGEAYNIEGSDLATNSVSPWRSPATGQRGGVALRAAGGRRSAGGLHPPRSVGAPRPARRRPAGGAQRGHARRRRGVHPGRVAPGERQPSASGPSGRPGCPSPSTSAPPATCFAPGRSCASRWAPRVPARCSGASTRRPTAPPWWRWVRAPPSRASWWCAWCPPPSTTTAPTARCCAASRAGATRRSPTTRARREPADRDRRRR
jgi:hypothetical protein